MYYRSIIHREACLRHTGQPNEATTGLDFYSSRWYDPQLGRWLQPDSVVSGNTSLAWDRYAYANNNPIWYNDPSGHCPWCIVAVIPVIGFAVGVATYELQNHTIWWDSQASFSGATQAGLNGAATIATAALAVGAFFEGDAVPAEQLEGEAQQVAQPIEQDITSSLQNLENSVDSNILQLPESAPFGNNGSLFLTENDYQAYGNNWGANSGRAFVISREDAEAMNNAPNIEEINHKLGKDFPNDANLMRVDIDNLSVYNTRIPTEGNPNWIPGGLTLGGLPERIIDPLNLKIFTSHLIAIPR